MFRILLLLYILLLPFSAVFAQREFENSQLAEIDSAIFRADSLDYWVNFFGFTVPSSLRTLPKEFKPQPQIIRLDSSRRLDEEIQTARTLASQWHADYNYAIFSQREGKRFTPYDYPKRELFSFDGYMNHARFEILGDSLGNTWMVSIAYSGDVGTEYYFDNGKLQLIDVRKNIPVRTGWETVSHDADIEHYYFNGAGLFAIERIRHPIEQPRTRTIQTKGLKKLSDSLQRKARIVWQLAHYISTYPGATCPGIKPQLLLSVEQLTAFFNEHVSKEAWAQEPKKSMLFIDFEIDTNGSVGTILDQRLKPGSPPRPFNEEVIRVLRMTKWQPGMAGCKPQKDRLTLMVYYEKGRFTSVGVS
jgi:hypothetical protein